MLMRRISNHKESCPAFQSKATSPDISLIEKIRRARSMGISMDVVPLPHAYDDEENPQFDGDADIRFSRMDNVERIQAIREKKIDKAKTAKAAAKSVTATDTSVANPAAQATPAAPSPASQPAGE